VGVGKEIEERRKKEEGRRKGPRATVGSGDFVTAHSWGQYMAWLVRFVAGLLEVGWAGGLKYTQGFTRLGPSICTGIALAASMIQVKIDNAN
jgi:Small Multidrug Resistance protein